VLTPEIFLLSFIVLCAGVVRGCIGFGFSALVVASGTLFIAPSIIVPMVVILEIVASLHMAASTWRQAAMKPLAYLLIGAAIATPLGVMALVALPAQDIRLLLSGLILLMSLLLLSGWQYKGRINIFSYFIMGLFSGVCNGAAAVGGLPVAVFLASMRLSMAQLRATLVLFFLATEVVFIVSALGHDLYNKSLFIQSAMMIVPMTLGIHYGSRLFKKLNEKTLKRGVIGLLLVLSSGGLVKGLIL
jgi:uncharacterized membrane protein YfcA